MVDVVYVFDKGKADYLRGLGFGYNEEKIGGKAAYRFFATEKLMESLSSGFSAGDFLMRKNMCF